MEDLPADRPMKYLVDIEGLMNDNGGLKDEGALKDFLIFMKKAKKMVPRCLLLLVINASDKMIQSKFCLSEGWDLLTNWLTEAKEETNDSFIREILTVMMKLPVNVSILKSNSCAKTVKQLAKSNPEVSQLVPKLARDVVIKWMSIINESFEGKEKDQSKEKEKVHLKKQRHESQPAEEPPLKKRKKDKERKRHDSTEHDINHHGRKEKRGSTDSQKDLLQSSTKSSEKHSDRHSEKHAADKHSDKHSSRKREREESPDTKQRKRATVKILPQRMRTAGIEEGGEKTLVTKSRSEVLAAKKEKLEKTVPDNASAPSIESMHQKIKVSVSGNGGDTQESRMSPSTPPPSSAQSPSGANKIRRPSHEIHESNSFMNALNAASGLPVVRKKKKPPTGSAVPKTKSEVTTPARSDKDKQENHEKNQGDEDAQSDGSNDSQGGPKKSSLAEIGSLITKKTAKKTVSWADEDHLRSVYYFELDETERVNVNRVISMEEMKRKEHLLERQNISRTLSTGSQALGSATDSPASPYEKGWYRPMGLEGMSCTTEHGKNSREVTIQAERERHVLAALYFSKEDIPPTAKEPDTAHEDYVEPIIIPLEDQTIVESDPLSSTSASVEEVHAESTASPNDTSAVSSSPKSPTSGTKQSSKVLIAENETFCLTPEVASLLKSITAGLTDSKKSDSKDVEHEPTKSSELLTDSKSSGLLPIPKQTLQHPQQPKYSDDVWRLLQENYPNLNLDEPISVERMRQLLEPIQEQLRACGALNTPGNVKTSPPPYHGHNSFPNHPIRPGGHMHQGPPPRPMHGGQYGPGGNGPPPMPGPPGPAHHSRPPPHHRPPNHPPHPHQRPPFPGYNNQGPRGYGHPGGPRMPPHRPHFGNNGPPPPPFNGPNGNGGGGNGHYRGNICRFFQSGACRSGPNCRFVHTKGGGPQSPSDL